MKNGPALAGHGAEAVRDAISRTIVTLPEQLRRSLTWDQGSEMAEHARLKIDAGLQVYFCDPHSPWQRATNENTNGLLRQYFPKGTDLSMHSANEIAVVAAALNSRPRKMLDWKTPGQRRLTGFSPYQPTKIVLRRPLESALAASIAVVHEPASCTGRRSMESFQSVQDEAGMRRPAHPPADDPAGIGVDDKGDIDEAGPGRDVGEVGDP